MNTNKKVHPPEIIQEVEKIAKILSDEFARTSANLRTIAKQANMSVNSVRTILEGKTANIASYALIAKALGTNLVELIVKNSNKTTVISVDKPTTNSQSMIVNV